MKTLRIEQHIFLDRSIYVVDARDIEKLYEAIDDRYPELEVKDKMYMSQSTGTDILNTILKTLLQEKVSGSG